MKARGTFVGRMERIGIIADHLNRLPIMKGTVAEIWKRAERLVTYLVDPPPLVGEKEGATLVTGRFGYQEKYRPMRLWGFAVRGFNQLAKENPIPLKINWTRSKKNEVEIKTDQKPRTMGQLAVYFLWMYFFRERGWERLKRCPQCGKWFVDRSNNKNSKRCSPACTWGWWDWSRRKEAGHHISRAIDQKDEIASTKSGGRIRIGQIRKRKGI